MQATATGLQRQTTVGLFGDPRSSLVGGVLPALLSLSSPPPPFPDMGNKEKEYSSCDLVVQFNCQLGGPSLSPRRHRHHGHPSSLCLSCFCAHPSSSFVVVVRPSPSSSHAPPPPQTCDRLSCCRGCHPMSFTPFRPLLLPHPPPPLPHSRRNNDSHCTSSHRPSYACSCIS